MYFLEIELLIKDLKEKLEASQLDYKREQIKLRQTYGVIKSMRTDLHQASGMIHDTGRLKIAVRVRIFFTRQLKKQFFFVKPIYEGRSINSRNGGVVRMCAIAL